MQYDLEYLKGVKEKVEVLMSFGVRPLKAVLGFT